MLEAFDLAAGGGVVGSGVLLDDAQESEFGLEGVAAASAAGQPGGEDHAVVGERGGGNPVHGKGCAECGQHDRAGDAEVGGHGNGESGAVVEPGEDLHIGARGAVGVGETVVGEVGLPALVRLLGLEPDVGGLRPLLRLRDHQPASRQVAANRGHGHGDLMMVLQVPRDGVWPGIKASIDQFLAEPDDQFDDGIADGARSGCGPT